MSTPVQRLRNHRSNQPLRIQSHRLAILLPLVIVTCAELQPSVWTQASSNATDQLLAQEPGESKWRKTRVGWVDLTKWDRPARVEFERRIELIHPLTFAAMLALFSVGILIWSSEEDQWLRLVGQSQSRQASSHRRGRSSTARSPAAVPQNH